MSSIPGLSLLSGGAAGIVGAGLTAGLNAITAAASRALSMLAELSSVAAQFAWDQFLDISSLQKSKSDALNAFEVITKSHSDAQRIFETTAKTSQRMGADFRESLSGMTTLIGKGFSASFSDELMRAMADMKAIDPQVNPDGIIRAIAQIKGAGRLQGDELNQITEAGGGNLEMIYAQIAKKLKIVEKNGESAAAQVRKLQEAGKIDSTTAIDAIMGAMRERVGGGEFGELSAKKASSSVAGLFGQLANLKDQIYSSINIDWSPVMRGIETLMSALKSDAATKFFGKVGEFVSKVFSKLDSINSDKLGKLFDVGSGALDRIMAQLDKLDGDKMGQGFDLLISGAEAAVNLIMSLTELAVALGPAFGAGLQFAIGELNTLSALIQSITARVDSLMASVETVKSAFSGLNFSGEGSTLGSGIIDGMVEGVSAGASRVAAAVSSVALGAITAGHGTLRTGSPSREFVDMFAEVPRGAVVGTKRGAPAVADATRRMTSGGIEAADGAMERGQAAGRALGASERAHVAGGRLAAKFTGGSVTSSSKQVTFAGDINVQTRATDPRGVASEVSSALQTMAASNG